MATASITNVTSNEAYENEAFSNAETVWPSGLRRWLKAPVRKGVGSNPTAVTSSQLESRKHRRSSADDQSTIARRDSLAEWSKALASGASPKGRGFEPHSCHAQSPP